MMKRRITFRSALAATIVTAGLATAASAQYGDMLKDAGKDKLKNPVNQGEPPAAAPAGGSVSDAASAGVKKGVDAKVGGADMKGAAMDGGKAAVDTYTGKPAVPGMPAAAVDDKGKPAVPGMPAAAVDDKGKPAVPGVPPAADTDDDKDE